MPTTPSKRLAATDRRRRRQALNISPSRTSASITGIVTPVHGVVSRRRRSGKITNNHFTPRTLNLALAGKKAARKATAVTDAFPVDKMQFFLGVLQQLAAEDKDGPLNEAYVRLLTNVDLQKEIVLFVSCSILLGSFSSIFFCLLDWLCPRWNFHWVYFSCSSVGAE